jgi:hypothetical protein
VAKKNTGIASINKRQLSAFPVLVPPLAAQENFRQQVEAVEGVGGLHGTAAKKAEATFRSLLARAFTGNRPAVASRHRKCARMIRDYQSLMRPVLACAAAGETRIGDTVEHLANKLGLTPDERAELLPGWGTLNADK